MESLIIEPTEDSPFIQFNIKSKQFIISGESRPENAGKFYAPVIDWVNGFEKKFFRHKNELPESSPIVFTFNLEYFNSASAVYFMDIILILKNIFAKGYNISIVWNYDKRDSCMLDSGKEFSDSVEMDFDFVEN